VSAAAKVFTRDDLARVLEDVRSSGRTIVFTCGVFDLLHVGHVRYLEFARALGDLLVVGVNSDDSVRRLGKGENRPLVAAQERAEVVAALASVDYVFIFDELRPDVSIRALRPNVHVKDAAYEGAELPEAAAVADVGGTIVFAPRVEGRSTTEMVERMSAKKS